MRGAHARPAARSAIVRAPALRRFSLTSRLTAWYFQSATATGVEDRFAVTRTRPRSRPPWRCAVEARGPGATHAGRPEDPRGAPAASPRPAAGPERRDQEQRVRRHVEPEVDGAVERRPRPPPPGHPSRGPARRRPGGHATGRRRTRARPRWPTRGSGCRPPRSRPEAGDSRCAHSRRTQASVRPVGRCAMIASSNVPSPDSQDGRFGGDPERRPPDLPSEVAERLSRENREAIQQRIGAEPRHVAGKHTEARGETHHARDSGLGPPAPDAHGQHARSRPPRRLRAKPSAPARRPARRPRRRRGSSPRARPRAGTVATVTGRPRPERRSASRDAGPCPGPGTAGRRSTAPGGSRSRRC